MCLNLVCSFKHFFPIYGVFVFFCVLSCNDSAASSLCNQREELHHSWTERERQKRLKELQQLRPAALKKFDLKYPTLTFSQILSTALTLFPAYHQQMRQNTSLLKRRLAQRKNLASEIVLFSNVLKNTHSWTDIRKCFWHLCDLTLRSYSWRVSRVSLRRSDLSSMSSLKGWLEGEKDTEGRN